MSDLKKEKIQNEYYLNKSTLIYTMARAIKKIKKKIKAVEKGITRNWKKIIIITVISVLLFSYALFMAGLKIRFAIQDALTLNLEPAQASFTVTNKQKQNATFYFYTDNSMFCTANCTYSFYDRSEDKLLDKGELMLSGNGHFNVTYELIPYRKGEGQKIYNFDVTCSNIKSFLCKTDSPVRRRSSFITLNYKLSEEENKLRLELMENISKSFALLNNASINLQKAAYALDNTKSIIGRDELYREYNSLFEMLNFSIADSDDIFRLWKEQEYSMLYSQYNQRLGIVYPQLYSSSIIYLNKLIGSVAKQNNLISSYNLLKGSFFAMVDSNIRYVLYSTDKEKLLKSLNDTYDCLNAIRAAYSGIEYTSFLEMEDDLKNASAKIGVLNESLNINYNNIFMEGINLTLKEYMKKCEIGYCENITNDVCYELDKIFEEYSTTSYLATEDITLDDENYVKNGTMVEILVSNESFDYYNNYCSNETNISLILEAIPDIAYLETGDLNNITVEIPIKNELTENPPMCCVYGVCSECCKTDECRDDPNLYPIILIHGHSLLRSTSPEPLLDSFNKIQYQLQEDGYINGGIIRFDFNKSDYGENDWGLSSFPITVKASYYYDYFYSLGRYAYITSKADNLDTYAVRLNDIINLVKYRTGKQKVNLIAHSMGGLVVRRYIQIFGDGSVDKLILIATPNDGVGGNTKKFCRVFGEKKECEDMYEDSIFLKKLNDPTYEPAKARVYTISGRGCKTGIKDGDGVVAFDSSTLPYAVSYEINGTCADAFKSELHSNILNIDMYPGVYEYLQEILKD